MEKQCPNCKLNFTPNSGKQKFCSDKCKVAFARKAAKEILGVKTAGEIPPPKESRKETNYSDIPVWAKEIEDYCELEGISPKDLIKAYKTKTKGKKEERAPLNEQVENVPGVSYFSSNLRKTKCGL